MSNIYLNINGKTHQIDADPSTPLLWVLRDHLQLVGTKFGCGIASCGACTVHVEGQAIRSCVMPVSGLSGNNITTIEGLSENGDHPVQKAWYKNNHSRRRKHYSNLWRSIDYLPQNYLFMY